MHRGLAPKIIYNEIDESDAAQHDARGSGLARGAHEFDPTANSAKLTTRRA